MTFTAFADWAAIYKDTPPSLPGASRLEKLPNELLGQILRYASTTNCHGPEPCPYFRLIKRPPARMSTGPAILKKRLLWCMLVSQRMHNITLHLMYENVYMEKSSCDNLSHTLSIKPGYRSLIRTLHLRYVPLVLEPDLPVLLSSLSHLRNLSLALGVFRIDGSRLLESPYLKSLELVCYKRTDDYKISFLQPDLDDAQSQPPVMGSLDSLSLNNLDLAGGDLLETLLPRCPTLRVLGLHQCQFNHGTLSHLHPTARLTELYIHDCDELQTDEIVELLDRNLAIKGSLENLSLRKDNWDQHHSSSGDLTNIMKVLPLSLSALRFTGRGAVSNREHAPLLQSLSTRLESMNIFPWLSLKDVENIVLGTRYDFDRANYTQTSEMSKSTSDAWLPSISTAVAVSRLQKRLGSLALKSGTLVPRPKLRHLDLRRMNISVEELQMSLLLGSISLPLVVVELPDNIGISSHSSIAKAFFAKVGWEVVSEGTRVWIERMS